MEEQIRRVLVGLLPSPFTGGLEKGETFRSHLVQPHCSSRVTHIQLLRAMSRGILGASKERDSTGPLWTCASAWSSSQAESFS